jgi:hypothetical protein
MSRWRRRVGGPDLKNKVTFSGSVAVRAQRSERQRMGRVVCKIEAALVRIGRPLRIVKAHRRGVNQPLDLFAHPTR